MRNTEPPFNDKSDHFYGSFITQNGMGSKYGDCIRKGETPITTVGHNDKNHYVSPVCVNKSYVDNVISMMMDFKFGRITVTLESDSFVQMNQLKLRPGLYNITVSPLV